MDSVDALTNALGWVLHKKHITRIIGHIWLALTPTLQVRSKHGYLSIQFSSMFGIFTQEHMNQSLYLSKQDSMLIDVWLYNMACIMAHVQGVQ